LRLFTSLSNTGYGLAGINITKELIKRGKPPSLVSPSKLRPQLCEESLELKSLVEESLFKESPGETYIKLWHQNDLFEKWADCGRYIGWPIFELDTFTDLEQASLKCPDELFVCSEWAKEIIHSHESLRTSEIAVIPLGVNPHIFFPAQNNNQDTYRFFTCGKWEVRKGHVELQQCFNKAFNLQDDVELHLMTNNIFCSEAEHNKWLNYYKNSKLGGKIHFINQVKTSKEVATIFQSMDCGVFISKGEGWNLELLEAMSCNKPVIATDYSGHTEFCNKDNSYLVDITEKELAVDNKWFFKQGSWAKFGHDQEEQVIEYMRHCYKNRPDNKEGVKTANKFTWENTVTKLLNHIGET